MNRMILTLLLALGAACEALPAAALPPGAPVRTGAPAVTFEADERLFVFVAWLNWVADEDPEEAKLPAFPERQLLRHHLKTLPATMRQRHRQAYEAYCPGESLYLKNGLLLADSLLYGPAPSFELHLPTAGGSTYSDALWSGSAARHLPPAALMREFFQVAGLHRVWEKTIGPATGRVQQRYTARALQVLQGTERFLRLRPDHPVTIRFNLLGNYGISGQTLYVPHEGRYVIKINPPAQAGPRWEASVLATIRHEYTHACINDDVMRHAGLIDPALAEVGRQLGVEALPATELIAQCVGWLDKESPELQDLLFYDVQNLLFPHFQAEKAAYIGSGMTFSQFLPTFFRRFDVAATVARWRRVAAEQAEEAGAT